MCGIIGYIGQCDELKFRKSLQNILHRGPDGQNIWHDDGIKLGHSRLSIIDLSQNASQPLCLNNRYVITYNGEIYNYIELRKELESIGIKFTTNSDTEVLLQAFIAWGVASLNKLNGMWAFAIWDKAKNELFISRDQLGKKPLFYMEHENCFAFSSEMKGLYPFLNSVNIDYDLLYKAYFNNFTYETTKNCLVQNINRFPAGSYGIYRNNKLSISKYYNPLNELIKVPKTYHEQVEMFKDLFLDACKIRMRSDVKTGSALSGGIDSSIISAALNNLNIKNHSYYTATFNNSSINELKKAKQVADRFSFNLNEIKIEAEKTFDNIFYNTYMFEELYYAIPTPFINLYQQIKHNGISVSIDGHGADELFGGYGFDFIYTTADFAFNPLKLKYINKIINDINPLSPLSFWGVLRQGIQLRKKQKSTPFDYFNNQLYESTFNTILPTLLRNYDRYSMVNGVEIRMPFLDHRIVSFAFSIPSSAKFRNGYTKSIIRDAFKNDLPKNIIEQKQKIGFNPAYDTIFTNNNKKFIIDELNSQSFRNSNIIEKEMLKKEIISILASEQILFNDGQKLFKNFTPFVYEKAILSNV